jgi:hypothetical protein
MQRKPFNLTARAFATAALVVLAGLPLGACGGSSKSSSGTTAATAVAAATSTPTTSTTPPKTTSTPTTPTGTTTSPNAPTPRSEVAVLRECLARNGIKLLKVGANPLLLLRSAEQLPKGVSRTRYEAVLRKCTGQPVPGSGKTVNSSPITNPRVTAALTQFATCMRQNKINLSNPNTSGNGPVFNTKGINTTSPQFRAALVKCSVALREVFKTSPGSAKGPNPLG